MPYPATGGTPHTTAPARPVGGHADLDNIAGADLAHRASWQRLDNVQVEWRLVRPGVHAERELHHRLQVEQLTQPLDGNDLRRRRLAFGQYDRGANRRWVTRRPPRHEGDDGEGDRKGQQDEQYDQRLRLGDAQHEGEEGCDAV